MSNTICPRCTAWAYVEREAEPDVGIMQPLFRCRDHGAFFYEFADGGHRVVFVDERSQMGNPGEAESEQ